MPLLYIAKLIAPQYNPPSVLFTSPLCAREVMPDWYGIGDVTAVMSQIQIMI